jgi:subtilisin family serine protease
MNDVICPNCHSMTPPYEHCLACNLFLGDMLRKACENKPDQVGNPVGKRTASNWFSLSSLIALVWFLLKRLLTSSTGGRKISTQMDAHLRRDCRRMQKHSARKLATSSTREGEVSVIAKVTDLAKFLKLVKSVTTVVNPTGDDQVAIVTARLRGDENEIEFLKNQEFVTSLKAARRVRPYLERTIEETFAGAGLVPADHNANGGKDVIIGIIDFGLDFVHRNFRNSDGSTRIVALWDQKASCNGKHSPEPFGYGKLFTEDMINVALGMPDPYKALGYEMPKNSLFDTSAHGTYVADVAAGNGRGSSCAGVARQADIVFVDVLTAGTPMLGPQSVGNTFGDSVQVLEAVHFIFEYAKAKDRPCVINISLGTNGGPHDGTSLLEEAIDWLVTQEADRAVVIAAGNTFGKALHATGRVVNGGHVDLEWRIPRFDATSNELEVWYAGEDRFTVELFDPDGKLAARVKPCEIWEKTGSRKGLMTVVNRLNDPNNKDNTINVFFERGVRDGIWTLRLRGDSVRDGRFHAWIERDERGQSKFVNPTDKSYVVSNECTLSSIACGRKTIVVGSYNAYEVDLPLSDTSSSGPTRDKREQQQPTVSAPGVEVMAAQSGTSVLRHRQSGTSLAAAAVAGTVALMLSEAREQGIKLNADQIRDILIRTARKNPPNEIGWDPGFGYGRICATGAVADVGLVLEGGARQASAASSGG